MDSLPVDGSLLFPGRAQLVHLSLSLEGVQAEARRSDGGLGHHLVAEHALLYVRQTSRASHGRGSMAEQAIDAERASVDAVVERNRLGWWLAKGIGKQT